MKVNFTTPEQSKRLLELGVPANSADCYYIDSMTSFQDKSPHIISPGHKYSDGIPNGYESRFCPCWSVGRLIEIYLTCALEYHPYDDFYTETPSLHLMAFDKDRLIEEVIEIMSEDEMDFSKLETI